MDDSREKKKPERMRNGPGRTNSRYPEKGTGQGPRNRDSGRSREPRREKQENLIVGRNAVAELLRSGAPIDRIYASGVEGSVIPILAEARAAGVTVIETNNAALDRMAGGERHQGIAAVAAEKAYSTVEDILRIAEERGEKPLIVICDGIEDPHNLGAVIRCADCAGAHGVIIPERRACGLTPAAARASAGAVAHMAVAKVTNIANTVEELKKAGVWTVNKVALEEYIPSEALRDYLKQPVGISGYDMAKVDVVAGATYSSNAVAENVRLGLTYYKEHK